MNRHTRFLIAGVVFLFGFLNCAVTQEAQALNTLDTLAGKIQSYYTDNKKYPSSLKEVSRCFASDDTEIKGGDGLYKIIIKGDSSSFEYIAIGEWCIVTQSAPNGTVDGYYSSGGIGKRYNKGEWGAPPPTVR